jgi:hypothetical protein
MADPETYASKVDLQARITSDGSADTVADGTLQAKLEEAGADIDNFCGRDFWEHADDVVTFRVARDSESLLLPNYPVRSIKSVSVDGVELGVAELAALSIEAGGIVRGGWWGKGAEVEITYTWGYDGTTYARPAMVREACLRLASRKYRLAKLRDRAHAGVTSERMGEYSVSIDPKGQDADVWALLKSLKRRGAA